MKIYSDVKIYFNANYAGVKNNQKSAYEKKIKIFSLVITIKKLKLD